MRKQLESLLDRKTKANLFLKAFSLTKVPLLFATGAKVVEISDSTCRIRIPFNKIVKNHLGSLYFGALSIGAEACVGSLATFKIYDCGEPISLVFKSFEAHFLKRATGPTYFICEAGAEIDDLIAEVLEKKDRAHKKIKARAEVDGEIVAEFQLELSLKAQT